MPGEVMELEGYILPDDKVSRDETDSEHENEEDEQQPEFLDMAEMNSVASGGHLFNSRVPPLQKVKFQTFSGKLFQVEGRFALRSPWWEVHCCVRRKGNRFVMNGIPSYKLRSDLDRQGWISIVSLFLNSCGIDEKIISLLFKWLPPNRDISLYNVAEVINEFSKAGNEGPAKDIAARISQSVHAACLYPHVMKYLPTLLPRQFTDLLCQGKKRPTLLTTQALRGELTAQQEGGSEQEELFKSLLDQLELIIANEVWKLGFSSIVHNELKVVRCEARLKAFVDCNLFQKIPPLQQCSLRVYEQIKKHCFETGSTFVEQLELCSALSETFDEQVWEAIHFLKVQGVVVLDKQKVVLQNFHLYETGIANCLRTLVDRGKWTIPINATKVLCAAAEERQWEKMQNMETAHSNTGPSNPDPTSIPDDHRKENPSVKSDVNTEPQNPSPVSSKQEAGTDSGFSPIELDRDHVQAAEMICANPVTIISGKAGCGKTTVISQLFKAAVQCDSSASQITEKTFAGYENDLEASPASPICSEPEEEQRVVGGEDEILLTAPTGRAASLLSKKTGFSAYTLHQVLFSFMNKNKTQQEEVTKGWKFKNVRILVVDEGSMVPVELLHSVLTILTQHAQLRKFIILGDVRQLPSIRPGNVLDNLFYSLKPLRWAIEMRTNHRAESQLIVKNAGLIADMGKKHHFHPLEFDTKVDLVDLGSSCNMLSADNKFIHIRLPSGASDDLQRAVKFLIDTAPGLGDHITSQFIAFKRKDVALINELCLSVSPGDKVCCTKNGYLNLAKDKDKTDEQPGPKKEKASLRLCNGEIFFIKAVKVDSKNRSYRYVTLDDMDGRLLTLDYRELMRECKLQHAWARTIHTFQGSENETIVFVVGDGNAQTWKHIYTAVTRGQKRVYVVSSERAIESAIQRREIPRKTRLGGLVKEQLVQQWMLHQNTPLGSQSDCSPQQSTPQGTHTPYRPLSSEFQSIQLQPRCLWKSDKQQPAEQDSAAALESNKRKKKLSEEHQEVPHKHPHIAVLAAEQCGDCLFLIIVCLPSEKWPLRRASHISPSLE
uniref:Helicase (DNA) B n=1 Tax=Mastacembelus armatus TaxID=205130 RepID=A0A3Q3NE21_9TELE